MSLKAKQLREERGKLIEQMRDINARADASGNLSATDEQQFQTLDARCEELRSNYERLEKMAQFEAEGEARKLPDAEPQPGEKRTDFSLKSPEYRASFDRWMRARKDAHVEDVDISILEKRGTSTQITTTDGLGGYIVPEGFSGIIEKFMTLYGGMMEAATVLTTGTGNPFPYPTVDDTSNTGAIITQGTGDTVSDITFAEVAFPNAYTYTSKVIKVSWELLQDSFFNLESLIAEIAGERLGRITNSHFTTGTGSSQPSGFITGSSSGKTAASATVFTRAELVDLLGSVDPAYLKSPKARWMFNNTTLTAIKKLAFGSADDRPLWVPSMREGAPDTLEGLPYTINQNMASPATGTKPIAVGDFGKYIIRVAKGIELTSTKEQYWSERVVGFAALCRMDGRMVNTAAIKYLTMA